ncbi:MAG: hypothetical protein AAF432_06890 [Planctomycetota bacterium]
MAQREALERRVYRLAVLLTGREDLAIRVLKQVLGDKPKLDDVDSVHLDRMTILRSREALGDSSGTSQEERQIRGAPQAWADALWAMPVQVREAWVLARVYRASARVMARSMDCSTTATERHLAQADAALAHVMGSAVPAFVEQVLEHSMAIDVPGTFTMWKAGRRRRRRRIAIVLAVLGVVIAGAAVVLWPMMR